MSSLTRTIRRNMLQQNWTAMQWLQIRTNAWAVRKAKAAKHGMEFNELTKPTLGSVRKWMGTKRRVKQLRKAQMQADRARYAAEQAAKAKSKQPKQTGIFAKIRNALKGTK